MWSMVTPSSSSSSSSLSSTMASPDAAKKFEKSTTSEPNSLKQEVRRWSAIPNNMWQDGDFNLGKHNKKVAPLNGTTANKDQKKAESCENSGDVLADDFDDPGEERRWSSLEWPAEGSTTLGMNVGVGPKKDEDGVPEENFPSFGDFSSAVTSAATKRKNTTATAFDKDEPNGDWTLLPTPSQSPRPSVVAPSSRSLSPPLSESAPSSPYQPSRTLSSSPTPQEMFGLPPEPSSPPLQSVQIQPQFPILPRDLPSLPVMIPMARNLLAVPQEQCNLPASDQRKDQDDYSFIRLPSRSAPHDFDRRTPTTTTCGDGLSCNDTNRELPKQTSSSLAKPAPVQALFLDAKSCTKETHRHALNSVFFPAKTPGK